MSPSRLALAVLLLVVPSVAAPQQSSTPAQSSQRDQQGIAILSSVVSAAGGVTTLGAIQDITASGTVIFNWAGQPVSGSVTVKGRGIGQYRLEANLPSGPEIWAVSNGQAFRQDANGIVSLMHFHPPTFENFLLPVTLVMRALNNSATGIVYVGLETKNGNQVHHIRIITPFTSSLDLTGVMRRAATTEVFVDPSSLQIVGLAGVAFAKDAVSITCPHEIQYANYQATNGIQIPSTIIELIDEQQTLSVQLNQFTLNSNLSDSNFQP